jgi:hypothetical protein
MDSGTRHSIHYIITLFVIFGGVTSYTFITKMHVFIIILILLHWLTNNGKCALSEVDYADDETGYTSHILKIFGINNTNVYMDRFISYAFIITPLIISIYRLN